MNILVCFIEKQQYGFELSKIHSVVLAVETTCFPTYRTIFWGLLMYMVRFLL